MAGYEVAASYENGMGFQAPSENGPSYEERPECDPSREREQREASRDREVSRERSSKERDGGEREKSKERDRDRDRRHRDRDRDRDRHRDRHRDRDRDSSDRRHRHHSRSHSSPRGKSKERSRSRSRSGSEDRRAKRASGFDVPPPGAAPGQAAAQPFAPMLTPQFPAMLGQMTQQATRHARQVYVGGLPSLVNEQSIASFFNQVMVKIGGNTAGAGDVVVNVYINQEKKFAFVEMRTVEEASNAMALDGIVFQGVSVRVRRPSDYNPSVAANLGPSHPNPNLNLAAVGLVPGAIGGGVDGPDRIFVGGLPYYLTEAQIRELLESFGPLRGFDLVKDRDTGNSKGYGFCVYQDPSITDVACAALNGLKMGDRTLTVRRATANGQLQQQLQDQAQMLKAMSMLTNGVDDAPATKVLCLKEAIRADELQNDETFEEILEDMNEECGKYGTVVSVLIPRPSPSEEVAGVGKVFVQFSDTTGSCRARMALHGRKFDNRPVVATYYSEDKFAAGDFSA